MATKGVWASVLARWEAQARESRTTPENVQATVLAPGDYRSDAAAKRVEYQAEADNLQSLLNLARGQAPITEVKPDSQKDLNTSLKEARAQDEAVRMLRNNPAAQKELEERIARLQKAIQKPDYLYALDALAGAREEQKQRMFSETIQQMSPGEKNAAFLMQSYVGGLSDWASGFGEAGKAVKEAAETISGNAGTAMQSPAAIASGQKREVGAKHDFETLTGMLGQELGEPEKTAGTLLRGLGYSTPGLLLSWVFPMSGGAGTAQAASGVRSAVNTLKNPQFLFTAVPMYGSGYREARNEGANVWEAQVFSVLNAFAGTAVELGGGIQKLPGSEGGLLRWIRSAAEEGGEEIVQGVIQQLTGLAVYDGDREWFSLTDPDAVINPSRMAEEFKGGFLTGLVLGGGSTAVEAAARYQQYASVAEQYLNELKNSDGTVGEDALGYGLVALGMHTVPGTDAHAAAERMAQNYGKGKKPTLYAFGRALAESQSEATVAARQVYDGVLNSATETGVAAEVAEPVARVAARFGRVIQFVPQEQLAAQNSHLSEMPLGQYTADGRVLINSALSSEQAVDFVLKHELTHSIEGTEGWNTLVRTVRRSMGEAAWTQAVEQERNRRRTLNDPEGAAHPEREVIADWIGKHLYTGGLVQAIQGNKKTASAVVRTLDRLRLALGRSGKNFKPGQIAALERTFLKTLESGETTSGDSEGRYSIKTLSNGRQYVDVDVDQSLFNGLSDKEKLKMAELVIRERFVGKVIGEENHPAFVSKKSAKEYAHPAKPLRAPALIDAKARASTELDNLLKTAIDWENHADGESGHQHSEAVGGFDQATILFKVGNTLYRGIVNVKIIAQGRLLTDITKIEEATEGDYGSYETSPQPVSHDDFSNTTIAENAPGVNTQYTQNGQKNAQNAFLPEEFAGVEAYRQSSPGVDVFATEEELGQPDTAFRSQMQTAERSDSTAKTVAKGQTLEELAAELGDRELNRRMYMAMQIDRPPATVTVDGVELDTATYLEAVERQLPDTREELEAYIADAERRLQEAAVAAYAEGDIDRIAGLPVNLQLFAARRKLEMELAPGENGSKVRRFFEQRLKGTDANQLHNAELMEFLAGRSETYSPISNQTTLNKAQEYLRRPGKAEKLVKRLGRDNPRDLFNEVELAAAELLINDARNDGDMELYTDLAQALSRKGTTAGRAVQILAMQAKLTPEGTLRAAQRLMQKETDRVHGEGVSKAISDMAGTLAEAAEAVASEPEKETVTPTDGADGGTNPPSRSVNRPKRTITPEEAQEVVERAVKAKIEDVPQLRRWLTRKDIQMELAGRIARLVNEGTLNDAAMERAFREVLKLPVLTTEDVAKLVELVGAMQDAEEGTAAHTDAVLAIYEFLGSKLPVTRMESLQSWRKFAMLFNLKTHIRNWVSNGAMYYGINRADSAVETLFQRWLLDASAQTARLGWSHTEQGRALMPTLERAAERAVQKKRLGGGKYDVASSTLGRHKTYFKWDWLNQLSGWNSSLLERADLHTFRKAYIDALGQIMVARGLTEVTEDISQLAYDRATDTVFQTDNAINDVLVTLKNYVNSDKAGMRVLGHAVDVVIPFTKTPANIATQSINHSPLGIAKAAFQFYKATQSGTAQQKAEAIHTLSQGLTGTALLAVGLLLGGLGLFTTGFGKTEKERAADELAGRQQNSLQIGGVSITLDWLQPAAAPLIVGASIAQRLREDGLSFGSVFGAVMDGTDSLFELSMLQSLYDILGGYDTGVSATLGSVAENLVSQSIPTLVGQVARTIDPVQRKTAGDNDFETVLNKVLAKIPVLTYLLEPELDIWGNEVYRTGKPGSGSALLNAAQQFALPWNTKIAVGDDDLSREILRLYQTQGSGALPSSLTRDQARDHGLDYTATNRELGAVLEEAILQFFRDEVAYTVQVERTNGKKKAVSKFYSDMTDEERRRVISRISTKAKAQYTDDEADDAYFLDLIRRVRNNDNQNNHVDGGG